MKRLSRVVSTAVLVFGILCQNPAGLGAKKKRSLIEMAILLDTSGSMQGLIEQAKSQLWRIVNEMAAAIRSLAFIDRIPFYSLTNGFLVSRFLWPALGAL